MSRKNVLIAVAIVLVGAAVVGANLYFKKEKGLSVTTEAIKARDLEAIVSASGKIQPKRLVNVTAETPGRVVNLAVNEGDRIRKGQFLLQIDPKSLRTRVDSARYDLSKVRIESPIDGIVTRRNIQEGETAMIGTMNNPGTVLLTLADMSIIQAEVEVDETNIPNVQIGQLAKITIDAIPEKTFKGHVSEIGNSRSEEHTSELQSPCNLVCRLLLEKKKKIRDT